ncbi:tetratricopeptide repeat protein [uncultured Microbacterium sp.]|uniref:tetratricopeptide repeat protein n=1 Tax=uncultured Microbacterium sp. TaxID=191216 RepID=UPI0025F57371|nr:tetratricopeptide repeat protein [uncultured Microbacterium sp.]
MTDDALLLERAEALLDLGRREHALREAGSVLARDPGNAEATRLVGEALLQLDRWEELDQTASTAVAAFPDAAWAWRLRAFAQAEVGAKAEAIDAAHRLRALDGESLTALIAYASVMASAGRHDDALEATTRALEISPEDADLLLAHAAHLWQARRRREARAITKRALRIDPQNERGRDVLTLIAGRTIPAHDLADTAQRMARAPGDEENEALFELASSRVLLFPASIVMSLCVAMTIVCVVTRGLWGWRIDTGLGAAHALAFHILLWVVASTIILFWFVRVRRELGPLLRPIVESRTSTGALSAGIAFGIAGALLLTLIGWILYAAVGDPIGTTALLLGLASAYAAIVLVALFQLIPRGLLPAWFAAFPVLLVVLSPGIVAALVLAALTIVGGTLYIILWALSGGRLPDLVPDADDAKKT